MLTATLGAQQAQPKARSISAPAPTAALEQLLTRKFAQGQAALREYVYREHVITQKDQSRDARTLIAWYVHGRPVSETVALDIRPLSRAEITAEHQRACARAAAQRQRKPPPLGVLEFGGHSYPFARLARDFLYTNPRAIVWHGRMTWAYEAVPNPATQARSHEEMLLLHSRGQVYVDAEDEQVVRISLHSTKPVHYAYGLVATIHQANFLLELQRLGPGLWLPAEADYHLDATILLVEHMVRSKQERFFDYTRASASTVPCSR